MRNKKHRWEQGTEKGWGAEDTGKEQNVIIWQRTLGLQGLSRAECDNQTQCR